MTTLNSEINFKNELNVLNSTIIESHANIHDYIQPVDEDINLLTNNIPIRQNTLIPNTILKLDSLFVDSNLYIESSFQDSFVTNNSKTKIDNVFLIDDKYNKININYLGELNAYNFTMNNSTYNQNILQNLYLLNNKTESIIEENFDINNNIYIYNTVSINNFINNEILFNSSKINKNLNIYENLELKGSLFSPKLNLSDIIVKNININNHLKATTILLPSNINNIKNSIGYNTNNNSIFIYFNNTYYDFTQKGFNKQKNTGIIQNYPNILFLQNNNITLEINDISKNININTNNIIINNNLNIKKDLYILNNLNNTVISNLNISKNLIFKNNSIFSIISNINYNNIKNGSIRFNNKTNLYEKYVHKWRNLVELSNDKSSVEFLNINDTINNTIQYITDDDIIINLNRTDTLFTSNNNYLNNLNILKKLQINNILSTKNIIINYNKNNLLKIHSNNNNLSYTIKNNNNIIERLLFNKNTNLDYLDYSNIYNFYVNSIQSTFKLCNTIQNYLDKSHTIIDNFIKISKYKLYNNILIKKVIIYLNKKINTELVLQISNSQTNYTSTFNISNVSKQYCIIPININFNKNDELYINIKSLIEVSNLSAQLNIIYTNIDSNGVINSNNSKIEIFNNNSFDIENRNFYSNVNIKENLLINNAKFVNSLNIKNNLSINSLLNQSEIFKTKNIIIKNNNIGLFENNPSSLLSINTSKLIIDKNVTNTGSVNVLDTVNVLNNINIKNTVLSKNIYNLNNINYNSLNNTKHILLQSNLNILNNVTINSLNTDFLIFKSTSSNFFTNIKYYNDKLSIFNNTWQPIIQYPNDSNNSINLLDDKNIIFKYDTNNLLKISNNSIDINNQNTNNNILSISNNFSISNNSISSNSDDFIVNNKNIINEIKLLEEYYYTPYNVNIQKLSNFSYNINYNLPRMYLNLNTIDSNESKYIEYMAYQLCLGNINSHTHPNWNHDSIIYYKNNLNTSNNFSITTDTSLYNNSIKFDFITNSNNSYNINIDNGDKLQYIYKDNTNFSFFDGNDFSLRIIPIYNIRDKTYLYYSKILNI